MTEGGRSTVDSIVRFLEFVIELENFIILFNI